MKDAKSTQHEQVPEQRVGRSVFENKKRIAAEKSVKSAKTDLAYMPAPWKDVAVMRPCPEVPLS